MILIPKGNVIIEGLNSYYLDIDKMCDYYHEIIGSCGIYFNSVSINGTLFFDHSDYLGGGLRTSSAVEFDTTDVLEKLTKAASSENFEIAVYQIDPENVYYWSSLFHAQSIYTSLKSDFTDLVALIRQMKNEKLSGYIEVLFENSDSGDIFFQNGKVVHSHCRMSESPPNNLPGNNSELAALLYFSKKTPGVFNVKEIIVCRPSAVKRSNKKFMPLFEPDRICTMLASMLDSLNKVLSEKKPRGFDFGLTLKKKFIEKADQYSFLDPFEAEFQYNGSKVIYQGNDNLEQVAGAVLESALELATENGQSDRFDSKLKALKNRYPEELAELNYGT